MGQDIVLKSKYLVFLYRKSRLNWGSTTLRAQQLAGLVAPHLPGVKVSVSAFSRREFVQNLSARLVPQGATVFVTKDAARVMQASTVDLLHRRSCHVCLDVVDTLPDELPGPELGADVLVSPSLNGIGILQSYVAARFPGPRPLVLPILHNADIRLDGCKLMPQDRARTVYWGAMKNAVTSPGIAAKVDFIDGSDGGNFGETLGRILHYNVHYAVRPEGDRFRIKPFTKGVNAAVLGAIVLMDRMVPDAVEFLGDDYPFMLNAPDVACVLDGLARLEDSFGGPDWALAQARCAEMAQRVAPEALAEQFRQMMMALGG